MAAPGFAHSRYPPLHTRPQDEQLAGLFRFKDRQTVSAMEIGIRRVAASELLLAAERFGVPLDYSTDPFRLDGEGLFSWRRTGVEPESRSATTACSRCGGRGIRTHVCGPWGSKSSSTRTCRCSPPGRRRPSPVPGASPGRGIAVADERRTGQAPHPDPGRHVFHWSTVSARLTASGSCWITRRSVAAGPLTRRVPCSHLR